MQSKVLSVHEAHCKAKLFPFMKYTSFDCGVLAPKTPVDHNFQLPCLWMVVHISFLLRYPYISGPCNGDQ